MFPFSFLFRFHVTPWHPPTTEESKSTSPAKVYTCAAVRVQRMDTWFQTHRHADCRREVSCRCRRRMGTVRREHLAHPARTASLRNTAVLVPRQTSLHRNPAYFVLSACLPNQVSTLSLCPRVCTTTEIDLNRTSILCCINPLKCDSPLVIAPSSHTTSDTRPRNKSEVVPWREGT